jgi:GrpB-like predicted nucleotidyltransferase (UPF0157 family)
MSSRYTFTDYSPTWPAAFSQEAEYLKTLLGDELITVHHIGSTSVPGLAAKPIIDLLPLVRSIEAIDGLTPMLERTGYQAWGEYGLVGRRYFTKVQGAYRTHNVHIYQVNDPEIDRHLAFCAYLRSHPKTRDEYAALKREVYAQHPDDIAAYNDAKNDWIKAVEVLALGWYRQQVR